MTVTHLQAPAHEAAKHQLETCRHAALHLHVRWAHLRISIGKRFPAVGLTLRTMLP